MHLGADADTTVSAAANMENATYFLSSGSADITTSDGYGGNTTFVFSTGNATIYDLGMGNTYFNLSSGAATVYATTSTDYWNGIFNYYNLSSGTYDLHGSAYGYDNFNLTDPSQLQTGTSIDGGTGPAADTVKFGAISPTT